MEAMPDREVGHFFCPRCGDSAGRVQLEIPRSNFTSSTFVVLKLVKFGCNLTVLARDLAGNLHWKKVLHFLSFIWLVLQYNSYICGSPINQTI